jgi:hypothetical protein
MHIFDSAINSSSIFKRHKTKAPVAVCVFLQHYLQDETIMNEYWKCKHDQEGTKTCGRKNNKFQQIYGPETIAAILKYTNKLSPATVKQCDF